MKKSKTAKYKKTKPQPGVTHCNHCHHKFETEFNEKSIRVRMIDSINCSICESAFQQISMLTSLNVKPSDIAQTSKWKFLMWRHINRLMQQGVIPFMGDTLGSDLAYTPDPHTRKAQMISLATQYLIAKKDR